MNSMRFYIPVTLTKTPVLTSPFSPPRKDTGAIRAKKVN